MKLSGLLVSLALVVQGATAHYFFDVVIYNGQTSSSFQYIRDFTRVTRYNPTKLSSNPSVDIRDNAFIDVGTDARCNQGAFNNAGRTQVLSVTAGSELRVKLGVGATMEHPGPSYVYMSRAPGDNVKAYDGSGDWFKIFQEGVCKQGADFSRDAWCTWGRNWVAATIPKNTPNGEYLVRFEHVGIHRSHVNQPEHYMSCVQVKVTGGGTGAPGPMTRFPGTYKSSDSYANFSVYNGYKTVPWSGPAVWSGSGTGGSSPTTSTPPPTSTGNPGTCAALFGQCGGSGWAGTNCCAQGTCKVSNEWYSQCL